jgi:hypothetical protein
MATDSGRELSEAPAVVEGPDFDERVVPEERTRRLSALRARASAFNWRPRQKGAQGEVDLHPPEAPEALADLRAEQAAESLQGYRREVAIYDEVHGVRPDDEVSTDAVIAVSQDGGGWHARWVLAEQDGGLVVRSLAIEPTTRSTPPAGITSSLLRALSPSRIAGAAAHTALQGFPGQDPWPTSLTVKWARREVADHQLQEQSAPRPGRPKLADDLLREVALAYLAEVQVGRGVLRRLGERFKRPETTIRDWVRIARREGWLGPATKSGRRGADPGPRLLAERAAEEGDHR